MKNIFKKKNDNKFAEPQYISGGNMYVNYQKRQAQERIDFQNLLARVENRVKGKVEQQTLQPFFLLELQTNYFVNTINYEIKDPHMFKKIKLLLRTAFKNGSAAIYRNNGDYMMCGIANQTINNYDETTEIKLVPITRLSVGFKSEQEFNNLPFIELTNKDEIDKNVVVLKWGSAGMSAWLYIWNFILIQHELLGMMNVDKYSYIKKFIHKVNDVGANFKEVEDYFDPFKPYIQQLKGNDLDNRLEINETATKILPNTLIEYYKQTCGVYYALFGRRTNNDYKKERSITQEIGLTEDNYTILEKDWIDEFKQFAIECKNKFGLDINVIERKEMMQDVEHEKEGETWNMQNE